MHAVCLTLVASMLLVLSPESASAADLSLHVPAPVSDLGNWLSRTFAGGSFTDLPVQAGGVATDSDHQVPTPATRAGGGTGHAPGVGVGELPADVPLTRTPVTGLSGVAQVGFDAATSVADPLLSTAHSTVYRNADGTRTRTLSQGIRNFRDAAGTWQPIDTTVKQAADQRLHEVANSLAVDFAPQAGDPALASFAIDATHKIAYGLLGATPVAAVVAGSTSTYRNVLSGTDVELRSTTTGIKESVVLHAATAIPTWTFPLQLTGLTPALTADGSIELKDATGAVRGRIPHGNAHDAKIDPVSGDPATTYAVTYALTTVGTGATAQPALTMSLDPTWLADPKRVFPVTVDPTFAVNPTSTYAEADLPAGDHSSEMTIKVGSYNSGPSAANSFLQFPPDLDNSKATVTAATLKLYDTWASSCTPQRFDVAAVTKAWTPPTVTTYPGPTKGGSIANLTPTVSNACANTAGDRKVGDWVNVTIPTSTVQAWSNGTTSDYGLALYAVTTDSLHWKQFDSANVDGFEPTLTVTTSNNVPPQIDSTYPGSAGVVTSLTPTLIATGHDIDNGPNGLQYKFQLKDANDAVLTTSALLNQGTWQVPAGLLKYGQSYQWTVQDYDGTAYSTASTANSLSVQVAQPPVTSLLSQSGQLHGIDPSNGNFTTTATDADVRTTGPSLSIERDYNARDPRVAQAFGAGWADVADARVVETPDGTGAVVTYPDGQEVGFAKNADGTWSPPTGRFATFKPVTGGYSLTDKNGTVYAFTQALVAGTYGISSVTDANTRGETFTWSGSQIATITSQVSGRTLALAWSTPSGAAAPHVATVTTDQAAAGDPSSAQVWTYGYAGDQLTSVCPPGTTTACTTYQYQSASQYRNYALDLAPRSFWPLAETSGTAARSAVLGNGGSDVASYSNVTLGQPGPLAGSSATAAGFNGTSSSVSLPRALMAGISTQSLSLWFRTTTPNAALFSYSSLPITNATTTGFYTPALYVGADGRLLGGFWSGAPNSMISAAPVTDGNWHHVVLSATGTNQKLYLDGAQTGSLNGTVSVLGPQNSYYLGAGFLGGGWYDETHSSTTDNTGYLSWFNGSIADVSFSAAPLTQADVTSLNAAGRRTGALLTSITRPSGNAHATMTYDPVSSQVTQMTDENGGVWKLAPPTAVGSSQIYRASVLGSGPEGYFRLGDNAGAAQAADELNAGLATYSNVTLGAAGPFSDYQGATFNGGSSYLQTPPVDRLATNGPNGLELWFKTDTAGGPGGVLFSTGHSAIGSSNPDAGSMPVLYVGSDGALYGQFWTGNVSPMVSANKVNDAQWHHVVITGAGNSQSLYLDGTNIGQLTGAMSDLDPNDYLGAGLFNGNAWVNKPGNTNGTGWSWFAGSIAELAIYPSQLSQDDVSAHWLAARNSQGLAPLTTETITDPGNATMVDTYEPLKGNRPVTTVDGLGKRTTYGYDSGGFVHTVTDPNGNVVTSGHDVRGNTVSQTTCQNLSTAACATAYYAFYPDATTKQLTPDPRNDVMLAARDGRSASATDATYATTFAYDTAGNRTGITTPPVAGFSTGRTTGIVYSDGTATYPGTDGGVVPKGLPVKITTPAGAVNLIAYNHLGDTSQTTDADGLVTTFTYDGLGREASRKVVSDTYPAGLVTTYTYGNQNQVVSQTDPAITDRVTGAAHAAVTGSTYDADGNLTSQTVSDATGGDASRSQSSTFNTFGQLASTTDGRNLTTTFTYDGFGNKRSEIDPSGSETDWTYDVNNRVLTQTLQYTGSPLNPQTAAPLIIQSRAYDPAGRLASITDSMGDKTKYTYFDNGLAATTTRTDPAGANPFVEESNTYDGGGNVTRRVTNNGATTEQTTVDAASRPITSVVDPSGVNRSTTTSYTPDDKPATVVQSDGSGASRTMSATYDPMGNVLSQTMPANGPSALTWYKLTQSSGTAVPDYSGTGNPATATSGVGWAGDSATFPGTAGPQITTAGPVVNGSANFTVSAWANLGSTGTSATAVGEDSAQFSSFALQYSGPDNAWSFQRASTDDPATSTPIRVKAGTAAVINQWVHLVGEFDANTSTMSFFLNGALVGTASDPAPLAGSGPLSIGRGQRSGAAADQFRGAVTGVQVYNRLLSTAEVGSLYAGGRAGAPVAAVNTVRRGYDKRGLPLTSTDQLGNVTGYSYDEAGQLTVTAEPTVPVETAGGASAQVRPVTTTGYNTFGEPAEVTDPNGNTVNATFDAAGHPVAIHKPGYLAPGSSTPIDALTVDTYDNRGQLVSESDPLSNTVSYTYDQLGHLLQTKDPAGGTSAATYDTNGDMLSITDASGATTQSTYDFLGRPLTHSVLERFPSTVTATTTSSYAASSTNPGGAWLAQVTSPTGVVSKQGYNNLGEATSATDPAGDVTTFGYDFLGRPTTTTLPDSSSTATGYNPAGAQTSFVRKATDGSAQTTSTATFDAAGQTTSMTDPRGTTITMLRDGSGSVSHEVQPVAAGAGIVTTFGHDAQGNRTRFTDGRGNPMIYTYNSWNMQETAVEPAVGTFTAPGDRTITTAYDADGRAASQTQPGAVTLSATYDSRGNLTGQSGTGAEVATASRSFGYDAVGRMISAGTSAAGSAGSAGYAPTSNETFTYNDRGAMLTTTGNAGASSFGYDAAGAMTTRTDAAGTSSYTYDTSGRLGTATDAASGSKATYNYNTLNQVYKIAYSTGSTAGDYRILGYDNIHRLSDDTLKTNGGTAFSSITYNHDGDDNVTSKKTTGFVGASTNTYTYDQANRLTNWNNGVASTAYTYDASGNRTKAGSALYTYDARDQLTADPSGTYTYTARGTLASQTTSTQTLASSSDGYGQAVAHNGQAYAYDALGRGLTVGTVAGSVSNAMLYSGAGNTLAADGTNTYGRDPDGGLLGVGNQASGGGTTAGTGTIAWTDEHSDVVGRFTSAGSSLTGSTAYDPFGVVLATSSPQGRLGFQSGWTDAATGNVNMSARWYNPALGQFSNRDTVAQNPVPNSAAANPFAYAGDNPVTTSDPSGHGWFDFIGNAYNSAVSAVSTATTWVTQRIIRPVARAVVNYVIHPAVHLVQVAVRAVGDAARTAYRYVRQAYNVVTRVVRTVWTNTVHIVRTAIHTVRRVVSHVAAAVHRVASAVGNRARAAVSATSNAISKAWSATKAVAGAGVRAVGSAASTAASAIAKTASDAYTGASTWVQNHASTIAGVAAGVVTFAACEAVTAGAGSIGCAMLAGAAGNAVSYALDCSKDSSCSVGGAVSTIAAGAAMGALGFGLGKLAGVALKSFLPEAAEAGLSGAASRGAGEAESAAGAAPGRAAAPAAGRASNAASGGERSAARTAGESCATPNSFAAATPVLLADGHTKPISELRVGDLVLASDPATGETAGRQVLATVIHSGPHRMVDIKDSDGSTVTATDHHPFFNAGTGGYTDATDLRPGDRLHTADGHLLTIVSTRTHNEDLAAYNLTVDGMHTYYVVAGTTPILVHNCNRSIWDSVEGTQPEYPGSVLPKSFVLKTNGADVWVHPNASKHRLEASQSTLARTGDSELADLTTQVQLRSLQSAVGDATKNGVPLGERLDVGGWQLEFSQRATDPLAALKHARFTG